VLGARRVAALRLVALGATLAACVAVLALSGSLSADRVRDWVDGYGAAGPLVFIAVSASLTVVLFPGPVLAAARTGPGNSTTVSDAETAMKTIGPAAP